MGNCLFCSKIDASKGMLWDAEEYYWESPSSAAAAKKKRRGVRNKVMDNEYDHVENDVFVERKMLLDEERGFSSSSPAPSSREVKLKLTRKELEDLVQGVEVRGLSLEELLAKLINGNDQFQVEYQRSWRPVLQSIPEVNSELSC